MQSCLSTIITELPLSDFRLLALNTPTYKLTKFLEPILKPLTTNELTETDSFGLTQSNISFGRSCIIPCSYKLLASKYMIYEVSLLVLYDFKNLLFVLVDPFSA